MAMASSYGCGSGNEQKPEAPQLMETEGMSDEELKIELYSWFVRCNFQNEKLTGYLSQLKEEDRGAPIYQALEASLEESRQHKHQVEAILRRWTDTEPNAATSRGRIPIFHGLDLVRRGESYFCLCGGRFNDERDLLYHLRSVLTYHPGKVACVCSICGDQVRTWTEIDRHVRLRY